MIGVIGHDAGAMEIITSYIRRHQLDCCYCLEGPAINVVSRKLGTVSIMPLEALVDQCEWLLCGTSFIADLEWRGIGLARQVGKRCVVVLDHWVNYRQRFTRYGRFHWPDELWVGDETASQIARDQLPELKQTLVPNAYFLDFLDEIKSVIPHKRTPGAGLNILYVCEPLRNHALALYGDQRYWGYTEEDALTYFLTHVTYLGQNLNQIVIRPHPQEPLNKYDWVTSCYDLPIICGENKTLFEQIAKSDIVVGCATMAMYVALLAGKRVISCIPPGGKTVPLPQRNIEDLQSLILSNHLQG